MPGDIFYWIFNMSIAAVICGAPVLLLRLCKRIPRRYFVVLWLIPFFRLCVPFGISGKYGLMAWLAKFTTRTVTVYQGILGKDVTMMNHFMGANSYFPITYKIDLLARLFNVVSVIWLAVTLALLLAFCMIYITTVRELRDAVPLQKGVYLSDKITTPSLYGIISPKVILPIGYNERDLSLILRHERVHMRRGDNLVRVVALAIVCVHWFNPFAWLLLKLLYVDIELACDEAVLALCTEEEKKDYAHALLSSLEKTSVFASCFGGARIRTRIEHILSYKKLSLLSAIALTALIVAAFYILLTNA